jgi:hypothetical protein
MANEAVNDTYKRRREKELTDLLKVLALPEGRRFIWRLLSEAGVFRTSFTGNSQTYFNEGRRDLGLLFLNEVMAAKPEAFTQMQREFISEQKAESVRNQKKPEA